LNKGRRLELGVARNSAAGSATREADTTQAGQQNVRSRTENTELQSAAKASHRKFSVTPATSSRENHRTSERIANGEHGITERRESLSQKVFGHTRNTEQREPQNFRANCLLMIDSRRCTRQTETAESAKNSDAKPQNLVRSKRLQKSGARETRVDSKNGADSGDSQRGSTYPTATYEACVDNGWTGKGYVKDR
jgi:hypothetical protein